MTSTPSASPAIKSLGPSGVVVTGGGSGIGRELATRFARRGAAVAILDITEATGQVAKSIEEEGGRARAFTCDISRSSEVDGAFGSAAAWLPALDVLINNAGISIDQGIRRLADEAWNKTIDVNLTGAVYCARAAARLMVPRGRGTILNISSRAWLGWFGQTAYAASKGGLVSVTRTLAIELARHGVRVNCIAPGLIDTPLLRGEPDHVRQRLLEAQPSRSIGQPDDVWWAADFLVSDRAAAITGQVLYVCGGKSVYAAPG
jgi:NAD(P)-dependent dehydrogenase (short-subunit alcohol dehydrogenase family)